MKPSISIALCTIIGLAAMSATSAMAKSASAAPTTVDVPMSHYTGTWLEIGRRPMWLTDGCVAGYTTYRLTDKPEIIDVEDGCFKDTPEGKLKMIKGRGTLKDFGSGNAKLEVDYPFFITWHYWVLYEAPDHSWFISADPKMKNLWIYTREKPSPEALKIMVDKAQSLGYDTSKLEFPAVK